MEEVKTVLREEIRLVALRGAISKWEKIVDGTGKDEGAANCPLCKVFATKDNRYSCVGCPVKEQTGQRGCDGSPYENWIALHQEHDIDHPSGISDFKKSAQGKAKRIAAAELNFLRGLLP